MISLLVTPFASDVNVYAIKYEIRYNERNGVSNHRRLDFYSTVCSGIDKRKTSKLHVTGLREGNSPVTGGFPTQRASNAENVSIWWRHQVTYHKDQRRDRDPVDHPVVIRLESHHHRNILTEPFETCGKYALMYH